LSNPKPFRFIKPEIRIIGVDDGKFTPHTKGDVLIVGVVLRGGGWVDGVMHTHISIDGLDATEKIASMINRSTHKRQLRLIMLNGITFGGFNIADIRKLYELTTLPVLAVTRDKPDLDAIHEALRNLPQTEKRWQMVLEAGQIQELTCKGTKLHVGLAGLPLVDAQKIVDLTATMSCFPEPLRVAHLLASGVTN
jgi:endonuclease V-like protein UPF0215 family